MNITEITVKLEENKSMVGRAGRVLAYFSFVIDNMVCVRDTKLLEMPNGARLLIMPNRKVSIPCQQCHRKNHLLANFCNHCGVQLPKQEPYANTEGRKVFFADVVFPISHEARRLLESRLIPEYVMAAAIRLETNKDE